MATVHMSEAEVARDLHAVLAKVQQGVEVIIEQDHRAVAVLKSSASPSPGRKLSECTRYRARSHASAVRLADWDATCGKSQRWSLGKCARRFRASD